MPKTKGSTSPWVSRAVRASISSLTDTLKRDGGLAPSADELLYLLFNGGPNFMAGYGDTNPMNEEFREEVALVLDEFKVAQTAESGSWLLDEYVIRVAQADTLALEHGALVSYCR